MDNEEVEALLQQCLALKLIDSYRWEDDYLLIHSSNASFRLRREQIATVLKVLLKHGKRPESM